MNNASYNTLDVKRVVENKLSVSFRDGKEYNGWFEYNGKRIARITVPHGRKPIPPKTYKKMADQLKLSIGKFDDLLACPLTYKDYINCLAEQNLL